MSTSSAPSSSSESLNRLVLVVVWERCRPGGRAGPRARRRRRRRRWRSPRKPRPAHRRRAVAAAAVAALLILLVPQQQPLEGVHVIHLREGLRVRLGEVGDETLDVLAADELEELEDTRVEQVVLVAVRLEQLDRGGEALVLRDISVVELVLEADARAEEAEGGEGRHLSRDSASLSTCVGGRGAAGVGAEGRGGRGARRGVGGSGGAEEEGARRVRAAAGRTLTRMLLRRMKYLMR